MPALGRTDSRLRMVVILLVFAVIGTAAGVRLGYWQVVAADELSAQIDEVKTRSEAASRQVLRADIVDRHGVVLAKTSSFDKLVAYPDIIDPDDLEPSVQLLSVLLDLSARDKLDYLETLRAGLEEGSRFVVLEGKLTLKQSENVRDALDDKLLPGYDVEATDVRYYPRKGGEPETSLASHVLGFVRADGRGGEGLERYYDDRLTTIDPALVDMATVDGTAVTLQGIEPEPLQLTLDAKLQRAVEKELHTAYLATRAKSVSALVMDPQTGAILAAASVPAYDAEDYAEVASEDMSRLRNRVFSDQYEPGSVMKIFTATAALDLGLVTPDTIIADQKKLEFWKYTVRNADHGSKGNLKVKDVIALSRNVATAKIARKLAPNSTQKAAHRLFGFWQKVGMGGPTGVDISGEAAGNWYDPDEREWSAVDLANRAFGQGVSVTLPQLARGISTFVNGGYLVQPHLVADSGTAQVEPERVLRAKTARQAKDILRHVTGSVPWYAKGSLIPGYEIGGKTGTAQIWDSAKGQWKESRFNHSFIGFVGGRRQEYVITVRLEEPVPIEISQGRIPLRIESYQLFQMVARTTIDQLKMKKSKNPEAGLPIVGSAAARELDPVRNRQAIAASRASKAPEAPNASKATKAAAKASGVEVASTRKQAGGAKPGPSDLSVASDPPAAGQGT